MVVLLELFLIFLTILNHKLMREQKNQNRKAEGWRRPALTDGGGERKEVPSAFGFFNFVYSGIVGNDRGVTLEGDFFIDRVPFGGRPRKRISKN